MTATSSNFKIEGDVVNRWWNVGLAKGLTSDSDIARFLLEHYELSKTGARPAAYCVHCHTPLPLYCHTCQLQLQQPLSSKQLKTEAVEIPEESVLYKSERDGEAVVDGNEDAEERMESNENECVSMPFSLGQVVKQCGRDCRSDVKENPLKQYQLDSGRIIENPVDLPQCGHDGSTGVENPSSKSLLDLHEPEVAPSGATSVSCRSKRIIPVEKEEKFEKVAKPGRYNKLTNVHSCVNCTKEFTSAANLKQHIKKMHDLESETWPEEERADQKRTKVGTKRAVCQECGVSFCDNSSLRIHLRTHQGVKPFVCDVCGHRFRQSAHLSRHRLLHSGEKPHKCSDCGAEFRWLCMLQSHKARHSGIYPHVCRQCGRGFLIPSALQRHELTHCGEKPFKCADCGAGFCQSYQLKTHWQVNHSGEKPYKCSDCGAAYSSKPSLTNHKKKHKQKDPAALKKNFVCDVCGSAFMNSTQLKVHMRCHSDVRAFTCKFCHASFKYPCYSHMKRCGQNTNDKPYTCTLCGSQFSSKWSLRIHTNTHTGEHRSRCSICAMEFNSPQGLTIHMRKHSGERPFVCGQCGKSFISSSNLYSHRMTHTSEKPLKCTECDARFTWKFQVKAHMVVHTGQRSYKCHVCSASFPRYSSLKVHVRLKHTKEKPYVCSHCDSAFTMSRYLQKHKQLEHADMSTA